MYPAITLDGFIADLKGECDSWISEEDDGYYNDRVKEAGCVLIGRKTYEQYTDEYPNENGATTFVYTSSSGYKNQDRIKFVGGSPQDIIQAIKDMGFNEVVLGGGGETNGSFAAAGLIDEVIVSVYGVTLGEGITLFGSYKPKLKLKLLSSTHDTPGIVKNHYSVLR